MKRMIADSLRLLEVAAELPEIDSERVILRGGSQGGGIALIVNALAETPIFATLQMFLVTRIFLTASKAELGAIM
ncbi:acetylxylan esterase [Enterococcus gallinarum]|nr:acetylxylan esterase [Enterococcus gallinarum]